VLAVGAGRRPAGASGGAVEATTACGMNLFSRSNTLSRYRRRRVDLRVTRPAGGDDRPSLLPLIDGALRAGQEGQSHAFDDHPVLRGNRY